MQKGQSSFEVIMVTLTVVAISTFILGNFFQLNDQTMALAILKADVMEQLDKNQDFYVLKKIYYAQDSDKEIDFQLVIVDDSTDPKGMCYMDLNSAANRILNNTKYNDVEIFVSCDNEATGYRRVFP